MATHTFTETREERVLRLIREALDAAKTVQMTAPSRSNSQVITELENAEFRARRDIEEKSL